MSTSDLSTRMKTYEEAARTTFPRRMPLIVRVDGKGFSKLTSGLKSPGEPFNKDFNDVMNKVAMTLCNEIQGAQIAYVQSDECSVFVHNYKTLQSQPWFDNQLQKIVSISAAIASATFTANSYLLFGNIHPVFFDSRAFILPECEVHNYMLWRQRDAIRNSVQMLARSHFSHKECENNSCEVLKTMLSIKKNVEWGDIPVGTRQGRIVTKQYTTTSIEVQGENRVIQRSAWEIQEAPDFSNDHDTVNHLLKTEE